MKTICCENIIRDLKTGKNRKCGRILGILTEKQILILNNDNECSIFWCPMCKKNQRWSSLSLKDGKAIWTALDKKPKIPEPLKFDEKTGYVEIA